MLQTPLRDPNPDQPWLQCHASSLDDIDRSLNDDDLQEYDSDANDPHLDTNDHHLDAATSDDDTRRIPTTGVHSGGCACGTNPTNSSSHRSNGCGGGYIGERESSPRDTTSHGDSRASSVGHSEQHRAGSNRRDVDGGENSPREATRLSRSSPPTQMRTVAT